MTTVVGVWWLSLALGAISVIDCARRPQSAWVTADRSRSAWIMWIVLGSLLFLGMLIAPIYWLTVVPRFSQRTVTSDFDKS